MRRYAKGANFEREVVHWFRRQGWWADRFAGSKSSLGADVVAMRPAEIVLIQCKTDGRMSSEKRTELKSVAMKIGPFCRTALAKKEKGKIVLEYL